MEDGAPKPKPKKRGPSRKRARPPKSGAKGGEGEQDEEEAAAQAKAEESSEDDWGWDSDNEADYVLCSSADGKVSACQLGDASWGMTGGHCVSDLAVLAGNRQHNNLCVTLCSRGKEAVGWQGKTVGGSCSSPAPPTPVL